MRGPDRKWSNREESEDGRRTGGGIFTPKDGEFGKVETGRDETRGEPCRRKGRMNWKD